jgi:hypothetical protein
MSHIKLHPKYGVNPTLLVCWWCQEETGWLALLGASYKNEAPLKMCVNFDPCPKCQEQMSRGITMMETSSHISNDRPELSRGQWGTGRWLVMTEDGVRRMLKDGPTLDSIIIKSRRVSVDIDLFSQIIASQTTEQDS